MRSRLVPVTNVEPTLDGSEDECTVILAIEHDVGGLDQVEIVVIPHIHLADAPATLEGLGHGARAPHDTAPAMSLGSRTRLYAAAARAKAHPTRSRPRNLVLRCPATVLIQPNASSMRLRMRWLRP